MNEVTKVHLGRQAFTISVAAQKELRAYLDAIAKQVNDADVAEEIELRMAELLTERGITTDKVILPDDIKYLKNQLGDPKDFKEDTESASSSVHASGDKRLFRDPDNAWVAGVAAGLAAYFGVDVLLIRILFIIGTFAWGGSILLYIVLWLLVPEAKTSSDRLQMAGKPITVESLKEVMDRADVKGAAHRAGDTLAEPAGRVRDGINSIFRLIVKIVGVGLTLLGLIIIIGLAFGGIYLLVHGNFVYDNLFPIGFKEHVLVYLAAFVAAMAGIFIILFGMAVFRRKWPIRAWLTGVLAGLTIIGLVGSAALTADTAPRVRDRYNANFNTLVKNVQPFTAIKEIGPATVTTQVSDRYYVAIRYYNKSDPSKIKVSVNNGTLLVDASQYQWDRHCQSVCLPNHFDLSITVYSPNPPQISYPDPTLPEPLPYVYPVSKHLYP
jgi:phage shock protein PspC (stress-responsive transcriptional regulator)